MPAHRTLKRVEIEKMRADYQNGLSKNIIMRRYHHAYETVTRALMGLEHKAGGDIENNKAKITVANELANNSDSLGSVYIEKALKAFCETLRERVPGLKHVHLNLETGLASVTVASTTVINLSPAP